MDLHQSDELFRFLIEDSPDPITILSPAGRIRYASAAYETVLGLPPERAIGRHYLDFLHPDDRVRAGRLLAAASADPDHRQHGEFRFAANPGRWHSLATSAKSFRSVGYVLVTRDVTEQHLLEAQLRQAHKFEAIGQLAAGIAHEINTPTQYVSDNVRFLQQSVGMMIDALEACDALVSAVSAAGCTGVDARKACAAIEAADIEFLTSELPNAIQQSLEGLERIAAIARGVKSFAQPDGVEKRAVDLNEEIENAIAVSRNEWKYVAEVETRLDPTLPPVPCVAAEINQVVLNLLINAAHAIAEVTAGTPRSKGRIEIRTRRSGAWAEVRLRDTGAGVPAAIRDRLFDPFFTTKPVGKGTGQGLTIARSIIVERHGGQIGFEDADGGGTVFVVRLPLQTNSASAM